MVLEAKYQKKYVEAAAAFIRNEAARASPRDGALFARGMRPARDLPRKAAVVRELPRGLRELL